VDAADRQSAEEVGAGARRGGTTTVAERLHRGAEEVVVERTFGWIGRNRRMSRDYEPLAETTAALIHICMIRLMLRRLMRTAA
jgi:hypothetical protein